MEKETVMKFLGEGGSLTISRRPADGPGFTYFLETSEIDEDLVYDEKPAPFSGRSFYEVFDELDRRYPWPQLYLEYADADFAEYIADALIEKLKTSGNELRKHARKRLERVLGIHLRAQIVENRTGLFQITVHGLTKETTYQYEEFLPSQRDVTASRFLLRSKSERWPVFKQDSIIFYGHVEIHGNSLLLKDEAGDTCHILPADKVQLTCKPLTTSETHWEWSFVNWD